MRSTLTWPTGGSAGWVWIEPDHSTFSKNRHDRFRQSDLFRRVFESVLRRCIEKQLVGGEGFAVDASLIGSDMVEMGPEHRNGHGLWSRPKKTKKRRRAFMIPLTTADALELDRWAETPVTFTNSRWKQPIQRFREDLYLYSPKGAQYTPDGLRARYGRWLADTPEGKQLCQRWKEWVAGQVKKYFWDIDPEDTPIIRPSTACEAPASWHAPSKAMGSTRSPTTAA
jgi:hypothetical protein